MRVGIDIGGTKAFLALVDEQSKIRNKLRIETGAKASCREVIRHTAAALQVLLAEEGLTFGDVQAIGIGVPGTVDSTGSVVLYAPNLGWRDQPVSSFFAEETGLKPRLAQDTRAAALAEASTPQMRNRQCVTCVTLGTGIGCGIVINGQIWHGPMGTAGEIGHIPVVPGGRECACGRRGCMEAYASGTGIARTAHESGLGDTCEAVFLLAEQGDAQACSILDEAITFAAMGISAMINVVSPDAVLLSGGLSQQKTLFVDPLIARIQAFAYDRATGAGMHLGLAFLGPDAPVMGAALLPFQKEVGR